MRNTPFWWILIGFIVLLDIYFFQVLKFLTSASSGRIRVIIFSCYWVVAVAAILLLVFLPYIHFEKQARLTRSTIFAIIIGLFLAKLLASVFFLIDDIRRGVQWLVEKIFVSKKEQGLSATGNTISRSVFLSWAGMFVGGSLLGSLIYGFGNKYKYRLKKMQLRFAHLPSAFSGIKIVHISDIHSGSFTNKKAVQKGVDMILQEKADLVLFTGDLVNNTSDEMKDYMDVFAKINAPMGVYSTLGNHDYGDYVHWPSAEAKRQNLENLKLVHEALGWRLLMNEHVALEKEGEKIALLGIENWSAKARFPKYGKMENAHAGTAKYPFKILMSHDPSHWRAEVLPQYPDIDLTLSGHTHGMQFGVEIPGLKWSPVQYVYREWAGLYENEANENRQKLYVNRGFGFLGYPGRVGILPEITVIELVT